MRPDVLGSIAEYKRREVAERRARLPFADLEARAREASPPRGFRAALVEGGRRSGRPALIAEVKKASPSKGLIRADFDPAGIARAYAAGGAACLSVLTDGPSFQGRDEDLAAARAACALPVLRKDFLLDPWQVLETRALGADAVLVILALLDDGAAAEISRTARELGMDVLVETHDEAEMARAAALGADLVGVNNRDLRTFVTDLAVTERLAPRRPAGAVLVCESGLFTREDVARAAEAGAGAVLVGESLMRRPDVEAAVRDLLA